MSSIASVMQTVKFVDHLVRISLSLVYGIRMSLSVLYAVRIKETDLTVGVKNE